MESSKKNGRSKILLPLALAAILLSGATLYVRMRSGSMQAGKHKVAGADFIRQGKPREAEAEWVQASVLSPSDANTWELLSELYIKTEQWDKAVDALNKLQKFAPNTPLVFSKLAACTLRLGNEYEAGRLAEEELKRNPDDPSSLMILAFRSEMSEDGDAQVGFLKRYLVKNPNDPETLLSLAQAYTDDGKFYEVLPVIDHLITVKPSESIAYAIRAGAVFATDASLPALKRCEADLLRTLKSFPLSAFARFTLGKVYSRMKDYKNAVFQLEIAQKLSPLKMDVPFALATAYKESGNSTKAAASLKRFEVLRKVATRASVLQKITSLHPNDFPAHLELGQLMLESGNYRKAVYYISRAEVLNPSSAEAKKAAAELNNRLKDSAAPTPG